MAVKDDYANLLYMRENVNEANEEGARSHGCESVHSLEDSLVEEDRACVCDDCTSSLPPSHKLNSLVISRIYHRSVTLRLLEQKLQNTEKKLNAKTSEYQKEITDLKRENEKQNQLIQKISSADEENTTITDQEWKVLIDQKDIAGMETLIEKRQPPSTYDTFQRAINLMHDQTKLVRHLCRLVSEDILTLFDRTKVIKVYAATSEDNPDITFIVVSRDLVPVPKYNDFSVYVKDISNAVLEDKVVDETILYMNPSNKGKLKYVKQELKQKLHTIKSVMKGVSKTYLKCPNVSQINCSTVKARKFAYIENKVYSVDCEPTLCIVIYVYYKGWIPVGWESFPATAEGYPIDVREFFGLKLQMISDFQCRTFPCYVYERRQITTQGLLKRQSDSSKYGLTSAHAVVVVDTGGYKNCLALDEDEKYVVLDRGDLETKFPQQNVRVERLAYGTLTEPEEDIEAFVDIALIHLDLRAKHCIESFSEITKKAFKQQDVPQFHYSKEDDTVYAGEIVLKFGTSSKLTFGTIADFSYVNLTNAPGLIHVLGAFETDEKRTRKPFSVNGDSGALVFKVNPCLLNDEVLSTLEYDEETETSPTSLILIGMVLGSPNGNETVTYCTQITLSLKALGEDYTFCE